MTEEVKKPIVMGKKYRMKGYPNSRVVVLCVNGPHKTLPVVACYDKNGDNDWFVMMYSNDGMVHRDLGYLEGRFNLVEIGEWDDFIDGEPVMVRLADEEKWERRHFACIKNGKPHAWAEGKTRWTSGGNCISGNCTCWNHCRRPTPEELAS